jgi:Zn-dependent peptidase ImmA (M78 family)/DNA-binding XRE family transcriptional regulator
VREARGISQSRLASVSNISQGTLSKFESQVQEPDETQLDLLAASLEVEERFFFRTDLVWGVGPNEIFHRKRQLGKKVLAKIHARMNLLTLVVSDLLSSVEWRELNLLAWDRDDDPDSERAAAAVRIHWHVPNGPIVSVSELLTQAGVLLIPFDFEGEKIDAIGRWPLGLPPMIFYNPETPDDRLRFTLAHELAHFCLHYGRTLDLITSDIERETDAFASALLLPADEVRNALRGLSLTKLGQLKLYWKSSMASLLYRARQLESISARSADELWRQMGTYGYRRQEPEQYSVSCEEPDWRFRELVQLHLTDLGYSVAELAKASGLVEKDLRRLLMMEPPARPRLALIK